MKKLIYYLVFLSVLSVVSFFVFKPGNQEARLKAQTDPSSIKDKYEWMLMRLRDPATGKIPANINRAELEYAMTLPGSLRNIHTKADRMLSNRWSQRGPYNIGGRTRSFATDITNENIMLAGGVSGGMWRSTDVGKSWKKTTTPDQLSSVSCLVQDTRKGKESTWYYGTGELMGNSEAISGNGIFKSTDDGLSWFPIASTAKNLPNTWENQFDYVWNIVVNHTNKTEDEVLAAYAAGGIARSTDGGNTWTNVLGGFSNSGGLYTDIAISPSGVLYATISQETFGEATSQVHGVFRSTDGKKWVDITPKDFPKQTKRIVIGIAPSDESQVYFFGETPNNGLLTINSQGDSLYHSFWKYTYKSGDGSGDGGSWENRSMNLPNGEHWRAKVNSQFSYNLCCKVKPDNPDVVFIGHSSMHRSNDGFKTANNTYWIGGYNPNISDPNYCYPNHHPDVHTLFFKYSDPNALMTGTDGGVHITYNCLADKIDWVDLNNGFFTTQFYSVAIDHGTKGSNEILGGTQDNSTIYTKWADANTPWTIPTNSDGFCCAIPDGGKTYYYSQNSSYQPKIKIWRFTLDDNGNPVQKTRIDPAAGKDFIWNTPYLLDPNDNKKMYLAGGNIVWRNNDLSEIPAVNSKDSTMIGWDSLGNTRIKDAKVTALGISKSPANVLFYGTSVGKVYKITNADKGDPQPVDITGKNFPSKGYVGCIAVDPENADNIFVVFTNYNVLSIFSTTDGGLTWTPVSGNLEENSYGTGAGPAVFWLEILKVQGRNMYFVGTSTGVYSTAYLAGMNTVWQQEGAETIGNVVVDMLDARESDGFIVAGTHGFGTFSANITDLPGVPSATTLVSPADGTKGIKYDFNLEWKPVKDAMSYSVEISKTPDFSSLYYTVEGVRDNKCTITNKVEPGLVKYYWRVTSFNSGGKSAPSETWSITSILSSPKLKYPATSADKIPLDVALSWEPVEGAERYHLLVSKTLGFNDLLVDKNDITTSSFSPAGLELGKKYYWKVSAINPDGESDFSGQFNFKTTTETSVNDAAESYGLRLYQNYPNPCSNSSLIKFLLPKSGHVSIRLYDERGSQSAVILDRYMDGGEHSVSFNSGSLPSGNYYYRMMFEGRAVVRNMVIAR